MRDPDDIQAYEAKQQRLVESIIELFHQEAAEDYLKFSEAMAVTLLQSLTHKRVISTDQLVLRLWGRAWESIDVFLNTEVGKPSACRENSRLWFAERQYLRLKVFEKVMGYISNYILHAYQTEEMKRNYKPD